MTMFQTTPGAGAGPVWQPLGALDYGAIGFSTVVDVAAAVLMVHVVSNAGWPPYTAAIPLIIVFSSLAAIVATLGVSLRYGMWGADGQEVGCTKTAFFFSLGLGALFSTAFLRVYRYHNVLVMHSGHMWPFVSQVICLLLLFTLAPAFLASPDMTAFDTNSLECQPVSRIPELFSFAAMFTLAASSLVLAFRIRVARVQAPHEFESAIVISITLFAATIALPLVHSEMEQDPEGRRVAMLVLTALTSIGVVAAPAFRPLRSFIANEEKLETSGNYSFGRWRSENKVQHMHLQIRKFQEVAISEQNVEGFPEIADFFRAMIAREEIKSYPLLQASTMGILDTYFREGAPSAAAVPISDECRRSTLTFRASSAFIFDRVRGEMLEKMGVKKVLPLPEDYEVLAVSRSHSVTTTRVSPHILSSGSGETFEGVVSPTFRSALAANEKKIRSSRASPAAPATTHSQESTPPQSPLGLSTLRRPSSSPVNPSDNIRRTAEVRATEEPDSAPSPALSYHGVGRSSSSRGRKNNPIFSLFGKLGGGAGERGRVQDCPSPGPPPSVVHMAEDEGFSGGGDIYDGPQEQGRSAKTAPPLGRTARAGGGNTSVRAVGRIADVNAAFGLSKKDSDSDDDDDNDDGGGGGGGGSGGFSQRRPTGFLASIMTKTTTAKKTPEATSGIGGYGSPLSSASSSPGGTDLAEVARSIARPLFGDPSRAVGRQSTLPHGGTEAGSSNNTAPAAGAAAAAAAASGGASGVASSAFANGLGLAEAYGLDLREEGDGAAAAEAAPSPPPKTATVNPIFGDALARRGGQGGGTGVKAMGRALGAEAEVQAVGAGRGSADGNKTAPPPGRRASRKQKRRGSRKSVGGVGSFGSALQGDVFTIAEADGEEEKAEGGEGGEGNDQNV